MSSAARQPSPPAVARLFIGGLSRPESLAAAAWVFLASRSVTAVGRQGAARTKRVAPGSSGEASPRSRSSSTRPRAGDADSRSTSRRGHFPTADAGAGGEEGGPAMWRAASGYGRCADWLRPLQRPVHRDVKPAGGLNGRTVKVSTWPSDRTAPTPDGGAGRQHHGGRRHHRPKQAAGNATADHRADVYSLGQCSTTAGGSGAVHDGGQLQKRVAPGQPPLQAFRRTAAEGRWRR
jgi:hypothetical protein